MSSHHFGCGQRGAMRSRDEGLQAQFASSPLASSISIGWLKWIFMLLSQSTPGRNNITSSDSDKGNRACPIQGEYYSTVICCDIHQEPRCQKVDWCDRDGIFRILYIWYAFRSKKRNIEHLRHIFLLTFCFQLQVKSHWTFLTAKCTKGNKVKVFILLTYSIQGGTRNVAPF